MAAAFAAVFLTALSGGVAAASAETVAIEGDPLTVYVTDAGNLQAHTAGNSSFSFFPASNQAGDAGFFIGFPAGVEGQGIGAGDFYGPPLQAGPEGVPYGLGSFGAVTGGGETPLSHVLTNTVDDPDDGSDVLEITQTTTYDDGSRQFRTKWEVHNVSGAPVSFRASAAADLFLEGSDQGRGFFAPGPPRFVGGVNETTARAGGLQELTTWSAYEEAGFSTIWNRVSNPGGSGFNNTTNPALIDNGVGVQWDQPELAEDATATYEVFWDFSISHLAADPLSATASQGDEHSVTFRGTDRNGNDFSDIPLRYTITGANPGSGTATLTDGEAVVTWTGANTGIDDIEAYADENGNSTREPNEPSATAEVDWVVAETLAGAPATAELARGAEHTVTFTGTDRHGADWDDEPLRFAITGANPGSGSASFSEGAATVTWTGTNAGIDTVEAYVDENGNSIHDEGEPSDSAEADWVVDETLAAAPATTVLARGGSTR